MNNKPKQLDNKVKLNTLIFSQCWEDPLSDHMALNIKKNETVFSITSGGCNTLGYLLFEPRKIYTVDINPAQTYLMEIKIAGIRNLSFDNFLELSGVRSNVNRIDLYNTIKADLSKEAISFWDKNQFLLKQGLIMTGKYEKFAEFAVKTMKFIQGKKRVEGLFNCMSDEEQKKYYDDYLDTKRIRLTFKLFFNKWMLGKIGLVNGYFRFDDGKISFAENFYKRLRKALRDNPIAGNYFLSLYLLGKYNGEDETPEYLQKQNYTTISKQLDKVKLITDNATNWLKSMPDNTFDCFSLSNICEIMSESETHSLFNEVARTGKPGAKIIFRNLMIPREIPSELSDVITKDVDLCKYLLLTDRSFAYSKVDALKIRK